MSRLKRSKYKFRGRRQRKDPIGKLVSCDGKVRWSTKQQAQEQAAKLDYRDRPMRAYKCAHCGYYHIGRAPRR